MVAIVYAAVTYALFLGTFAASIGFIAGLWMPRTVDVGPPSSLAQALSIDAGWFVLFAVQHSGMARPAFKRVWTRIVPASAERSTYVLTSTGMLALLVWQWRPIPTVLWHLEGSALCHALLGLSFAGWALAAAATFSLDHLELFGLRQPLDAWRGRTAPPPVLRTPLLYRFVRHPLYVGFLIGFWATPTMTAGHALLASGMSGCILIGVHFEERDLVRTFGDDYRRYQRQVRALVPTLPRSRRHEGRDLT